MKKLARQRSRALRWTLCGLLAGATAHAELYPQAKSRSPDGAVIFAISYSPGSTGDVRGCFLQRKSQRRIGDFFFLPGTDAEADHPGTYPFDHYKVFEYVWSADSTHVAIVHQMRHFAVIHPFRRRGPSFQALEMPDLVAPLQKRLAGVLEQSRHTDVTAGGWSRNYCLVATISRAAQVTNTGNEDKDWRMHSLRFRISFDRAGKPTVEAVKFRTKSWL